MRATFHNGRTAKDGKAFLVKHNDRRFNVENAEHIDSERTPQNRYFIIGTGRIRTLPEGETLEGFEHSFYRNHFTEKIEARNNKYLAQRHPERCGTIEDYYKFSRTCPEESILQIGKQGDIPITEFNIEVLTRAVCVFIKRHRELFPDIIFLDASIHADESSLHCHLRKVYIATDRDGREEVSQNKCLEKAGFSLPYPNKKIGRYNNRKLPYSEVTRNMWLEICREMKVPNLEMTPAEPRHESIKTEDYKRWAAQERAREAEKEAEEAERRLAAAQEELSRVNEATEKTAAAELRSMKRFLSSIHRNGRTGLDVYEAFKTREKQKKKGLDDIEH